MEQQSYPITPEQEQELRAIAQVSWAGEGVKGVASHKKVNFVAWQLAGHVFESGRLTNTVSMEVRRRIAQEEMPEEVK